MKPVSRVLCPSLFLVLFLAFTTFLPARLSATDCNEGAGPLNPAQPAGLTPQDIIRKFAAQEAMFKLARDHYTYTQDVTVETLDGDTVDGKFHEITDVLFDDRGKRLEDVTYAPQPTLTRIYLSKEDYDMFRKLMPFVLTTDELPEYNLLYAGQQHVDEIDTYVFDVAPRKIEKDKRYFQGRIWVESHDLQIVKTCGRSVPDVHKKNQENLTPKFVTYRQQFDNQFWFPVYSRADDTLHFSTGDVQVREIVKYSNYKRFGATTRITFNGEAVPDKSSPPPKK